MNKPKKRIWLRVLLGVLCLVIVGGAALAAWQHDNIQALWVSRQYSAAELAAMLAENEAGTERILERLPGVNVRPMTESEKAKLRSGELTGAELAVLILAPPPLSAAPPVTGEAAGSGQVEAPAADEKQQRTAELIANIYVLREVMTGQLDAILQSAKADYNSIPAEQRTAAVKQDIIKRSTDKAFALEDSSDAQMNSILGELETLLVETGGDTNIVAEIRQAYKDEKSLKKSYYLNQYA
ncbi:MAG: hypothetical protein LBT26_01490 [Clostridiales Family XIII bacterium]|jgi:hypothetical protein|nr:hypothetical protein [Clostridiales Family XIII bacterium]